MGTCMTSSERPLQDADRPSPEASEAQQLSLLALHGPAADRGRRLASLTPGQERQASQLLEDWGPLRYESTAARPRGVYLDAAFELPDGATYLGHWLLGERCDRGICLFPDGRLYEGEWKKDFPHGFGRTAYPNGDLHVGLYDFGFPSGQGRYLSRDGVEYKGDFFKGHPHGRGAETHQSGFKYEGEYAMGLKHGQGRLFFPDGLEYAGKLSRGAITGFGEMTWPDGRHYAGEWKDGERHSHGVFYWKGIRFEGDYLRGKRHGKGKFQFTDGRELHVCYSEDKIVDCAHQDGLCSFKDPDPTQPYLYSFLLRDGQLLQESVSRFAVSTLPDGSSRQDAQVGWPAMNLQYRNKVLGLLQRQLDALPSEEAAPLQAPGPLSSHEDYKRGD